MTLPFDFTSQEFLRDPAAGLARLRAAGPLVEVRFPIVGRTWLATTQEMVGRVLKDSQSFTMRKEGGGAPVPWWLPRIFGTLGNTMLTFDEPDHTRLRQIVDEAFRRRAVLDMEPHILEIADGLARDLFAQGSPADLVERYARVRPALGHLRAARPAARRPAQVHGLGRPVHRHHRRLGHPAPDPGSQGDEALSRAASRGRAHHRRRRPDRGAHPRREGRRQDQPRRDGRHGLPAARRRIGDDDPSDQRLGIRAAAQSAVARLAGAGLAARRLGRRGVPALPVARAVFQAALRAPRFGAGWRSSRSVATGSWPCSPPPTGTPLPTTDPEKLDLERRPNRHISFGTGIHFCLGHQLARIEGKCAVRALFARWPSLELAVEPASIRWRKRPGLRAIASLPVTAGAR